MRIINILESAIAVCENSETPSAVYDKELIAVWKNSGLLPDALTAGDFEPDMGRDTLLPPEKETVLRHRSGSAAQLTPLAENGEVKGLLVRLQSIERIEELVSRSEKLTEQQLILSNIRAELSKIARTLEELPDDPEGASYSIRLSMLRAFASTVNSAESSRIFGGMMEPSYMDVSVLILSTLREAEPILEANGIKLISRIAPGISITTSYRQLEAILLNLILNGCMYNDSDKKEVFVSLKDEGDLSLLTVSDNGTSADIEHIEKMSRYAERRLSRSGGESVALAMTRRFCEIFGAGLSFERSETGGLTVTLRFPKEAQQMEMDFSNAGIPKLSSDFDRISIIFSKGLKKLPPHPGIR